MSPSHASHAGPHRLRSALRGTLVVVLLAAALPACSTRAARADPGRDITVSVENRNWQDVTVFALLFGKRIRLGTVTSMTDRSFDLPPSFRSAEVISLVAELIGSTEWRGTGRILVRDHSEVLWTLENQLTLSSYVVR